MRRKPTRYSLHRGRGLHLRFELHNLRYARPMAASSSIWMSPIRSVPSVLSVVNCSLLSRRASTQVRQVCTPRPRAASRSRGLPVAEHPARPVDQGQIASQCQSLKESPRAANRAAANLRSGKKQNCHWRRCKKEGGRTRVTASTPH
jgi:hypothetical protein